jgi:serine/threonine-protein kinase HipA
VADLLVELYGHPVGHLRGSDWRTFDFQVDAAAFERFELGSAVLSETVPFVRNAARGRANRRRNYFSELLPEGDILDDLARRARVAPQDTIGMLRAHGRDMAGAVQVWDPEAPGEPRTPRAERVTTSDIASLLLDRASAPLGNRPDTGKSSLAGVQPKIVLARDSESWSQVLDGYPSTHILKPEVERHPTLIYDEEYGARLGRAIGVVDYHTQVATFDSVSALVIQRYDRGHWPTGRLHQEDMTQALGVSREGKYQEHRDGSMNLARIAGLFRHRGDMQSLRGLLRTVVLAVAVGNLDLHGKNISMLHYPDGTAQLAPGYDIVPLAHHNNVDGRMAMAIGGVYPHKLITAEMIMREGESWGLRDAQGIVDETLARLAEAAEAEQPDPRAFGGLSHDIQTFIVNLRAGREAGVPVSGGSPA